MPNIPADVVGQAASTAATATQNAANLTQAPQAKWHDVWTQTGSGLLSPPAVSPFIPKPGETMTPEVAARIDQARASAAEMGHTNLDGLADGMSQQAGVVADQAAQLWNGKLPDGQSMSTLQRVGAAFGILSSIEQLITMPLGAIPFPAFPALRVTDMDVGLPHAHMHPPNLIPPNPVPVPLPSTGPVIPIPFVSGASKTLINMMPAARCGDMGLGVFCGGFFPMYEVFLGSANVWIEGNRAGRMGIDVTKHCIFSAPKPSDPPVGPMFGATIMGSANVMIGGVPLPSLSSMAIGAAFKAAFKGVGKVIGAARKKLGKGRQPALNNPRPKPPGDIPEYDPRLQGPPSGRFPPRLTGRAEDLVDKMAPGGRQQISDITAAELAAMTNVTGDEFAVAVGKDGNLYLLRGTDGGPNGKLVQPDDGDQIIVHTHPQPYTTYATPVSAGDANSAAWVEDNMGWDHPQAVVDAQGNVHHFDGNGVVADPTMSPIGPGGSIDGIHTNPQTGSNPSHGMAIPPSILNPSP